jgi:tetratricopeptide (TPR) repeat protein
MKHNGRTAFTFAAALMAALALHSASAAPQAPGRLDGYFSQGVDLYRQKDYPGALAAFLKAQDEAKTGPLFYNLGNCYLKTGSLGQAILYYERALESMPEAS